MSRGVGHRSLTYQKHESPILLEESGHLDLLKFGSGGLSPIILCHSQSGSGGVWHGEGWRKLDKAVIENELVEQRTRR